MNRDGANDAIVDTYRALIAVSPKKLATPGAGVVNVLVASKRIRNWHRRARAGVSLKRFARELTNRFEDRGRAGIARQWLINKGYSL